MHICSDNNECCAFPRHTPSCTQKPANAMAVQELVARLNRNIGEWTLENGKLTLSIDCYNPDGDCMYTRLDCPTPPMYYTEHYSFADFCDYEDQEECVRSDFLDGESDEDLERDLDITKEIVKKLFDALREHQSAAV